MSDTNDDGCAGCGCLVAIIALIVVLIIIACSDSARDDIREDYSDLICSAPRVVCLTPTPRASQAARRLRLRGCGRELRTGDTMTPTPDPDGLDALVEGVDATIATLKSEKEVARMAQGHAQEAALEWERAAEAATERAATLKSERDQAVAALQDAQQAVCSEYCGVSRHHANCERAQSTLRALTAGQEGQAPAPSVGTLTP